MTNDIGPIHDCTGCGFCCTKAKCGAAVRLYPTAEKCPALKWDGERHVCDLMQLPGQLGDIYRAELYAGEGCCMNLNSWRQEPLQDRTKDTIDPYVNEIPSIMQKFLAVLGRQWITADSLALTVSGFEGMLVEEGMPEKQAHALSQRCLMYLRNQRSTACDSFMG